MKSLHAPSRWRTKGGRTEKEGIRTDEVHDESAIGEAPVGLWKYVIPYGGRPAWQSAWPGTRIRLPVSARESPKLKMVE